MIQRPVSGTIFYDAGGVGQQRVTKMHVERVRSTPLRVERGDHDPLALGPAPGDGLVVGEQGPALTAVRRLQTQVDVVRTDVGSQDFVPGAVMPDVVAGLQFGRLAQLDQTADGWTRKYANFSSSLGCRKIVFR